MPQIRGLIEEQEEEQEQEQKQESQAPARRRGIGSYAAKLEEGRQQGLSSRPDEVMHIQSQCSHACTSSFKSYSSIQQDAKESNILFYYAQFPLPLLSMLF